MIHVWIYVSIIVHKVVYNLEIVTQYSHAARIQIVLEDVK